MKRIFEKTKQNENDRKNMYNDNKVIFFFNSWNFDMEIKYVVYMLGERQL